MAGNFPKFIKQNSHSVTVLIKTLRPETLRTDTTCLTLDKLLNLLQRVHNSLILTRQLRPNIMNFANTPIPLLPRHRLSQIIQHHQIQATTDTQGVPTKSLKLGPMFTKKRTQDSPTIIGPKLVTTH